MNRQLQSSNRAGIGATKFWWLRILANRAANRPDGRLSVLTDEKTSGYYLDISNLTRRDHLMDIIFQTDGSYAYVILRAGSAITFFFHGRRHGVRWRGGRRSGGVVR